ncbi:hypothetical protein ACK03K_34165 [[Kitasatospora] papulosa]|uniref:hypothetical protein n=1 Tax=[Kitasatospora] papulosa TaxID=1464011 RepID=UPI0039081ABD
MSTPAPEPAPFDPHAFPADLIAAHHDATRLRAELEAYAATLPWSREPHPGWKDVKEGVRARKGRPASPGWTPEQTTEHERLKAALLDATQTVYAHPWWTRCAQEGVTGPAIVDARQALKRAPGAVPDEHDAVGQEDVDKAA